MLKKLHLNNFLCLKSIYSVQLNLAFFMAYFITLVKICYLFKKKTDSFKTW